MSVATSGRQRSRIVVRIRTVGANILFAAGLPTLILIIWYALAERPDVSAVKLPDHVTVLPLFGIRPVGRVNT